MTLPEPADRPQRYTFLLSLWRESDGGCWHAALRAPDDETRIGFATIELLAAFLRQLTVEQATPHAQGRSDTEAASKR
jgi:hypothetical protein